MRHHIVIAIAASFLTVSCTGEPATPARPRITLGMPLDEALHVIRGYNLEAKQVRPTVAYVDDVVEAYEYDVFAEGWEDHAYVIATQRKEDAFPKVSSLFWNLDVATIYTRSQTEEKERNTIRLKVLELDYAISRNGKLPFLAAKDYR